MFFQNGKKADLAETALDQRGKLAAIDRAQAVIEFDLEGNILTANKNFLMATGYDAAEVKGRHHSIFVTNEERDSPAYRELWHRLRRGEAVDDKFKRVAKGGRTIWMQGSCNPIMNADGKPFKIVEFATDVTGLELQRQSFADKQRESAEAQQSVMTSLGDSLGKLAEGDFRHRLNTPLPEAYAKLRSDLNGAFDNLAETINLVSENAAAIRSATQEISTASDDLSRRTEQQAASLEETAAALGEITSTVKKTSEGAKHAREVVTVAKKHAEHSGVIVSKAVEAMGAIERSSGQIGQIIGVIDEIAFQTNLLALNAGVEAARAGDAGRGFAVVASEVRALAQRSAEAAKEIKALINTSTQQVVAGVSLVGETGKSLEGIVAQITEINEVVTTIATSASEQATALEQINTAVVQMDQVTQQNAAMVEEATAASHGLIQEADKLAHSVDRFKTDREPKRERAPAARPAPQRSAASARGKPASAPVPAMKTTGRGGAAPKPAPAATSDDWEEF